MSGTGDLYRRKFLFFQISELPPVTTKAVTNLKRSVRQSAPFSALYPTQCHAQVKEG